MAIQTMNEVNLPAKRAAKCVLALLLQHELIDACVVIRDWSECSLSTAKHVLDAVRANVAYDRGRTWDDKVDTIMHMMQLAEMGEVV